MDLFSGANLLLVSGRVSSHDIFMTFVSWRLVNDMIFHSARWCWAYIKGSSMDAWIVGPPHFHTIPLPFQNPLKYGHGMGNLWEKGSCYWGSTSRLFPNFHEFVVSLAGQSHFLVGAVLLIVEYPTKTHLREGVSTWKILKVYTVLYICPYIYIPNIWNRKAPT